MPGQLRVVAVRGSGDFGYVGSGTLRLGGEPPRAMSVLVKMLRGPAAGEKRNAEREGQLSTGFMKVRAC